MRSVPNGVSLVVAALVVVLSCAAIASAAPVSKCDAAKKKCIGKYVAAQMGCHAKAESKGTLVDPGCLAKGVAKITGGGKGCFDKNDAKVPNDCSNTGNAALQIAAADQLIVDVVDDVDPAYPAPNTTKCGAARKKCVGKKAAGLTGCSAKASKDGVGDPACAPKIMDKFGGVKGCDVKALAKGPDCLGTATTASLEIKVDAWVGDAATQIEGPGGSTCGNGMLDAGEDCDPVGPNTCAAAANTSAAFVCKTLTCQCACPTTATFTIDGSAPESILDSGWTGISHRSPIVGPNEVTVTLGSCTGADRPCGTCQVSGPIANPLAGAGQLANHRCTNDTSIQCTTDAPCLTRTCIGGPNVGAACTSDTACPSSYCPAAGTCMFNFGTMLPLSAGGVTTCVVNTFVGSISGTADVETGEEVTTANLRADIYTGLTIDNPCPRCVGDGAINDGLADGTCASGARSGLPCDANGDMPSRPDFGRVSLDCPISPTALIATLPIALHNETNPVVRTLTASSPNCNGSVGEKCFCGSCNNANQEPCFANVDCPMSGGNPGICNGSRCLGGANNGAPCTTSSSCPVGICGRPGEPTKPTSCLDDTTTINVLDCVDGGDGEGMCTQGPIDNHCTLASGHGHRGCLTDGHCGGVLGSCTSENRPCFLTGGGSFQPIVPNLKIGTDTLIAAGVEDPPVNDTSHPTVGSVFCLAPTGSSSVNNVAGLPGPARVTIKGTAVSRP